MHLRLEIDRFLRANPDFTPSRLGREIANDPALVSHLRKGRDMRPQTEERLKVRFREFLEKRKAN